MRGIFSSVKWSVESRSDDVLAEVLIHPTFISMIRDVFRLKWDVLNGCTHIANTCLSSYPSCPVTSCMYPNFSNISHDASELKQSAKVSSQERHS